MNCKRSDGLPLIEIQVRKAIRCDFKNSPSSISSSSSSPSETKYQTTTTTTDTSTTICVDYHDTFRIGIWFDRLKILLVVSFRLESSYTIYVLTQEFQSDVIRPSIFIDFISDQTISTNRMRIQTKSHIRDHLANDVLGEFQAYGKRIENVR